MCEAGPSHRSEPTREVDAEFERLADLAEHLKTMRKEKVFRDLLARAAEKKDDALRDLN